VAQPAFGADDGSGVIVRVEAEAGETSSAVDVPSGPECTYPVATERPQ
jgi:hypothetical protein